MKTQEWNKISDQTKDLVNKLLKYSPKVKISTKDALLHHWFDKLKTIEDKIEIQKYSIKLEISVRKRSYNRLISFMHVISFIRIRKWKN